MKYKDAIAGRMKMLAEDPRVRFVGYNTKFGPRMNGTLVGCEESAIETPVAENLMCGIAIGLALEGFLPVLCFERMDFCLAGADALINHIGAMKQYGMTLPMVIRVIIGTNEPLDPGFQHRMEYFDLFRWKSQIATCKVELNNIDILYNYAKETIEPMMLVERKDLYEEDIRS